VLIFGRMRSGLTPEINALATLILVASIGVACGASLVKIRPASQAASLVFKRSA